MKNDVKDWLPKEFEETKDLEEFRRYFLSEQFVLVSWDGCYGDASDERYKMFLAKLTPETPPSVAAKEAADKTRAGRRSGEGRRAECRRQATAADDERRRRRCKTRPAISIATKISSATSSACTTPATGTKTGASKREKWLKGRNLGSEGNEHGALVLPDCPTAICSAGTTSTPRWPRWPGCSRGRWAREIHGTLVHSFGPIDGAWYHDDPRRLRAQLFKTVTTGPDVLASLTREGGELDATRELDGEANQKEAERRLEGALFGKPDPTTGKTHDLH